MKIRADSKRRDVHARDQLAFLFSLACTLVVLQFVFSQICLPACCEARVGCARLLPLVAWLFHAHSGIRVVIAGADDGP
jgi:hypothetical protein